MKKGGPDFIGIGAQKCGTTWLSAMLELHPEVSFPSGKEIHFWDAHCAKGLEWYLGLFGADNADKKQGEITPAYAILPESKVQKCFNAFPESKLFYTVRDPVERAWSSARMALSRAEMTLEEASDQWFLDHFRSQGSRMRGDYAHCVATWLEYYPPEQLFIMFYDDIKQRPREVLGTLAEHIGVDRSFYDQLGEGVLQERIFMGEPAPLRPALAEVLEVMYDGWREKLEPLIRRCPQLSE